MVLAHDHPFFFFFFETSALLANHWQVLKPLVKWPYKISKISSLRGPYMSSFSFIVTFSLPLSD